MGDHKSDCHGTGASGVAGPVSRADGGGGGEQ